MMKTLMVSLLLAALVTSACADQQTQGSRVDAALLAAVDSMMPRLEVLSGLKKVRPITMKEQSREALREYIEERMREEMPPEELAGMRAAYAALGLVPDTLDLERLLLDLYTEQVAGYYDPKTDAFYMVEGTPADLLRPTLMHELVHALQDQHADLDSLISRERGNDRQTAAQSAIEGHATLVMFAMMMDAGGDFNPAMLPDMSAQLAPLMEAQNAQFPVFRRAPRIIRETMLFPYISGAGFVQEMWRAHGTQQLRFPAPLGALLPQSTEQVLHPRTHYAPQRDEPVEVRFADAATGTTLYENTLGELEIRILLAEHLGDRSAAAGWDGDRYRVLDIDGRQVLAWQTVWDDAAAADRFATAYRAVAGRRSNRVITVEHNTVSGREGVWIVDAPAGFNVRAFPRLPVTLQ